MVSNSCNDSTPIIVGAAQFSEALNPEAPTLSSPIQLAAAASKLALADAGNTCAASDIDCIAMVRMFSDTAPAWRSPFGRSSNPPESLARLIGATPTQRIYSAASGTQPLELLAELMSAIYRGDAQLALLSGCEAIANQRYAVRNNITLNWEDHIDLPMDERKDTTRSHTPQEIAAKLYLPVDYFALMENLRAHQRGHDLAATEKAMAKLLASFSQVAAKNPHAVRHQQLDEKAIASPDNGNYALNIPYRKLQIAQDAVNQSSALLLTSVGHARKLGIDPAKWIFVQAYSEGQDRCLTERIDPARSQAMKTVLENVVEQSGFSPQDDKLIDIYSCFPSAVEAVCEVLDLPTDGSRALTVTGGLPYFGGPGNNYCSHAIAEMVTKLRGTTQSGLITANGSAMIKHAAVVLGCTPGETAPDWAKDNFNVIGVQNIPQVEYCDTPEKGKVLTYTLIYDRKGADRVVLLAETADGKRFIAGSEDEAVCAEVAAASPIGRSIQVLTEGDKHLFSFC